MPLGKQTARVFCRWYGFPSPRPLGTEAGSNSLLTPQGTKGTSSHLQCQGDGEDPEEERHQPKAANEEGSPSQALNDQALGQGQRERLWVSVEISRGRLFAEGLLYARRCVKLFSAIHSILQ